jgi:flagellar protein FliS
MNDYRNIRAYRETDLQTMGKEKLIVLLYQKMLEHFAAAADAAGADRPEMSRRLGLAQRIVTELRGALDHAVGGEIAGNLASIYDFVFHEILQMQLDQDPVHAINCHRVLEPLMQAWGNIPPGAADRELRVRHQPGTEPASSETTRPAADGPAPEPLVSLSA